jgi:hypothetical protein
MLCSLYLRLVDVVRGVVGFVSFCGSVDFVLCVVGFGGLGFYSVVVIVFVSVNGVASFVVVCDAAVAFFVFFLNKLPWWVST